jgi:hypothetical protein
VIAMTETTTLRDDFEEWLMDMDDAIDRFLDQVPANIRAQLDFSPASLDVLEAWLLQRYPSVDALLSEREKDILDGAARYVGQTFREQLGGHWDIVLDDPQDANYRLPILTGFKGEYSTQSPVTLVTAATDRRTGSYLCTVLHNIQQRAKS